MSNNSDNLDDSLDSFDSFDSLESEINKDYSYPDVSDDEFQEKIYRKREFYYYRLPSRKELTSDEEIKDYRNKICNRTFELSEHQAFLSNYINPNTPYRGVLLYHGTGTGKCCSKDTRVMINNLHYRLDDLWLIYSYLPVFCDDSDSSFGEWIVLDKDIYIKSYSKTLGVIIYNKILKLYREKIDSHIRSVTLENNYNIKTTYSHKFLIKRGGLISWTSNINIGDHVASYIDDTLTYSRIINIERVKYVDYVYDLEIETDHNFVAENIIVHNTCAAITIAEKFKDMVVKYGTKIHVLVPGPLVKENWKREIFKCTKETYIPKTDPSIILTEAEINKNNKLALSSVLQYYRIMSYRTFYRKVLGEKIRLVSEDSKKVTFKKRADGEYERDEAIDKITSLNNSIIIVDEAHHVTNNYYGEALLQILKNSHNLKVLLLSATPMQNSADEIVAMLNFIRPQEDLIHRDKIFSSDKNYMMEFKKGGPEYLKKMSAGYVSYLRGADPITFAERIDIGVIPKGLLFTKVIKCQMNDFQRKAYDIAIENSDDSLNRESSAASNFVFPSLSSDLKSLVGTSSGKGVNEVVNLCKTYPDKLNKLIGQFFDIKQDKEIEQENFISIVGNKLTGDIFKSKYLKYFSTKFYTALKNLNKLYDNPDNPKCTGSAIAFIYSNLVVIGIDIFEEVLRNNGYLEYDINSNYKINPDTRCYKCGVRSKDHNNNHKFYPATFFTITGKSDEGDENTSIADDKKYILDNVYSNIQNKDGRYIKFLLGSKVMSEAFTLNNTLEVHILDVHYNLGIVDQVVGRAIRFCSHYNLINDNYKNPKVKIYKYVVSVENGLSTDEVLYQKAEKKHILVKKVERLLKEVAIDCPINRHGNIFPEEVHKNKNCVEPENLNENNDKVCPALCDYTKCEFKCDSKNLNQYFFDEEKQEYRLLDIKELDYNTFNNDLARNEINYAKNKIKDLYKIKFVYTIDHLLKYVKRSYDQNKIMLFEEYFVYKALDELIPITENDFNNYKDVIFDKYSRPGYIIYIDKYYIFQPFDQNENIPMYYRTIYDKKINLNMTLHNYMKNTEQFNNIKNQKIIKNIDSKKEQYEFDMEYYFNRPEYKFIGIIDKESDRKKDKILDTLYDVFKIRDKRAKVLDKNRGTDIPSFKGAVCSKKDKNYIKKVAIDLNNKFGNYGKELNIVTNGDKRENICEQIMNKLLFLERYSEENITYIMTPSNHQTIPYPLNILNRKDKIINNINDHISDIKIDEEKIVKQVYGSKVNIYKLIIKKDSKTDDFHEYLIGLGGKLDGNKYIIMIE